MVEINFAAVAVGEPVIGESFQVLHIYHVIRDKVGIRVETGVVVANANLDDILDYAMTCSEGES